MKTIRAFVAVNLDIDAVRAVAEEQKRLKDRCAAAGIKVAWIPPPNMHITVRFLGDVAEPFARALETAIEPAVRRVSGFEVEALGLGAFPDLERPRVLWAGVKDDAGRLAALYSAVSERLVGAGLKPDDKPFRSHMTIGRVKDGPVEALTSVLADGAGKSFGRAWVRDVTLYKSELKPTGAEYTPLWRLPLQGGPEPRSVRPSQPHPGETPDKEIP
ncbi:MAG: RNA 2',3'-cyclic phosphodiesterase [Deltaproteobacteria bacterium]|nr:RNA 2',3'-cyclic phosphodiesterase [Deltaproteobacteria bacterium]